MTCSFGSIAARSSVYHRDCGDPATHEAVDSLAPVLQRRSRPVCVRHARFLVMQGFWIFPPGDGEARSLRLEEIQP